MAKTRQVKLKELVTSEAALAHIANLPVSAQMSFRLGKVLETVAPELARYQKEHTKLVNKYRVPCNAPEGRTSGNVFTDTNRELLDTEYDGLLDTIVDLPFGRIKVADLLAEKVGRHKEGDKEVDDFLKLSGQEIYQLSWLLKAGEQALFVEEE